MQCSQCGNEQAGGAFCDQCGAPATPPIGPSTPPPPPPPPSPDLPLDAIVVEGAPDLGATPPTVRRSPALVVGLLAAGVVLAGAIAFGLGGDDGDTYSFEGISGQSVPFDPGPGSSEPELLWSTRHDGCDSVRPPARVGDLVVLVETGDGDDEFILTALDTRSGEQAWTVDFDGNGFVRPGVGDTLLVENFRDNRVTLLDADGEEIDDLRTRDSYLDVVGDRYVEVSYSDGEITVYDEEFDRIARFDGREVVALPDGFAALQEDRVTVHDSDGDERWSERARDAIAIAATDDLVVVSDGSDVTAFDIDSGDERWDERGTGVVAVFGRIGIVHDDEVEFVDDDGDRLFEVDGTNVFGMSIPDPVLVVGASSFGDGDVEEFRILDPETGDERQRFEVRYTDDPSIQFVGQRTYEIDGDRVTATRILDGEEEWTIRAGADVCALNQIGDALLLVTEDDVEVHG